LNRPKTPRRRLASSACSAPWQPRRDRSAAIDNVDIDYGLDKLSHLLNNDPKLIRSPKQLAQIRQMREQREEQQRALERSKELSSAAKNLGDIPVGGTQNALTQITGMQ